MLAFRLMVLTRAAKSGSRSMQRVASPSEPLFSWLRSTIQRTKGFLLISGNG